MLCSDGVQWGPIEFFLATDRMFRQRPIGIKSRAWHGLPLQAPCQPIPSGLVLLFIICEFSEKQSWATEILNSHYNCTMSNYSFTYQLNDKKYVYFSELYYYHKIIV